MSRTPFEPLIVRPRPEDRRWTRLPPVADAHRAHSRQHITQLAEGAAPQLAVVLGAGRCDEIPLAALANRFGRVRLFDEDAAALAEGIAEAELDSVQHDKLEVEVTDLTGVGQALSAAIRQELSRQALPKFDDVAPWIEALSQAAEKIKIPALASLPPADLVIASCVISQLHLTAVQQSLRLLETELAAAGRPELLGVLRQSPRWTEALWKLARQFEIRFVDGLVPQLVAGGVAFVSDSVQMCYVHGLPDGGWASDGLYRMTRTPRLADYFDARFVVHPLGEWPWVVDPPQQPQAVGRVYRVQALRVKSASSAASSAGS